MEMFENYTDIVTVDELRNMLKIGRNMAYRLVKDGEIKSIRVGSKYLIPKKCVIEFVHMQSKGLMDGYNSDILTGIVNKLVNHVKEGVGI